MKKVDTQGMTLIESIASIFIIVIASMVLLESFFAVTTMIRQANTREVATEQQLASLVGGTSNEGITVTTQEKEASIMVEGSSTPIVVTGKYLVASGIDGEVALHTFETTKKTTDMYEQMLEQARTLYNETKDMTAAQKNQYLDILEQESNIDTGMTCGSSIGNDELRVFYYLKYGFPKVHLGVINACNTLYDKMHPAPGNNTHEANAKIGERDLYLKPYFIEHSKEYVLAGVYSNTLDTDGWKTMLVYNETDKSLYYKIFLANNEDIGSTYALTSITSLTALRTDLYGSGWQRLIVK